MGEFGEELFVEGFVGGAGEVRFAFGAWEFGRVFVGLFDEFFDPGAGSVVVEEFVVALFYAWYLSCQDGRLIFLFGGGEHSD